MALYLGSSGRLKINVAIISKEAGKYSYNGIFLPALPEWDTETYPYAMIWQAKDYDLYPSAYESEYCLVCSKTELVFTSDNDLWVNRGTALVALYTSTDGDVKWGELKELTKNKGYHKSIVDHIWCNSELRNADGSIYLIASDPIPAPDNISYKASTSYLMLNIEKQPIAYSYNGVILPDINEVWTDELKAQYPYALLVEYSNGRGALLYFSSTEFCVFTAYNQYTSYLGYGFGHNVEQTYYFAAYRPVLEDYWSNTIEQRMTSDGSLGAVGTFPLIWSNHDIINTADNSVYLAASEPVPVYE